MLILYVKDNCRYSKRALDAVEEFSVPVEIRNKSQDPAWGDELEKIQGFSEVPYLVDTESGDCIDESEAIVAYFQAHFGKPPLLYP